MLRRARGEWGSGEWSDFVLSHWSCAHLTSAPRFELKLRAPGSTLQINQGFSPKSQRLGTFDDNIAHSNRERAGITTYESGYKAPGGTKWHNIRVYKNRGSGLFQHGTSNIHMIGGLLADNSRNARNFHHDKYVNALSLPLNNTCTRVRNPNSHYCPLQGHLRRR